MKICIELNILLQSWFIEVILGIMQCSVRSSWWRPANCSYNTKVIRTWRETME